MNKLEQFSVPLLILFTLYFQTLKCAAFTIRKIGKNFPFKIRGIIEKVSHDPCVYDRVSTDFYLQINSTQVQINVCQIQVNLSQIQITPC